MTDDDLETLNGVGPVLADALREAGFDSANAARDAAPEALTAADGIGESTAHSLSQHGDDEQAATRGWPTELHEHEDELLALAEKPISERAIAKRAGVSRKTLRGWLESHPEFREAYRKRRSEAEVDLTTGALHGEADPSMARFLLQTTFDHVKTEKREVENTGDGPLSNVTIDFNDVDT